MSAYAERHPWSRCYFLLFLMLITAAGGCLAVDPWEDARIEAEVKAHLVAQQDANLTRLGVTSRKATVYLSGSVESAQEKALAEALAKDVRGVRGVVDELGVRARVE